ncbi:MAG: arginine--tRNA ligase [Clostridia bacterium]
MNMKQEIAKQIAKVIKIDIQELESYIEVPKDETMGDYAFPCFRLAKSLKKAPPVIANEIKENMELDTDVISKVEVVGGYLNFYSNQKTLTKQVLYQFEQQKEKYGTSTIGEGKNVVIDYSAPNIAKPFHIGHLRSTVIGAALYNIYQFLGYHTIGVNHLGDYGTQFGKLIEGYKRWGQEYAIEENPIDELTKIYIRINKLCEEDEETLEACRNNFKKLEDKDPYCVEIWEKFRSLSLKEFQKVYQLLGSKFDSWNGEAFYSDKMGEVIEKLEKTNQLVESEGAKVISLEEKGMPPCIIEKTNGSTTYATRDLAAILYRARNYDFDKALYVTSYEQVLHFKQIFEVAKLLDLDEKYIKGLEHVPFGMVRLKEGKMSTREGNIVKLEDLLQEAITRAEKVIEEKNPMLEDKKEVAKKVGIGAVIFNDLSNSRIKDEIFDWDMMLNFQGETGPYIQYIYVRTKSVIEKAGYIPELKDVDIALLQDIDALRIIKQAYILEDILKQVVDKNEPSILARYLIDLSQSFSTFYNNHKIIGEDKKVQDARLYLTNMVGSILKQGCGLLGIQMPDRM